MEPTEGYTNFLLVVFLAPFIKLGFDPLLITRIFSYLSALAISAILFTIARRKYDCSTLVAGLIASLVLIPSQIQQLSIVGLETVIYALFLLIAFHFSTEFLDSGKIKTSITLSIVTILAMLVRPEAIVLYVVMTVIYLITLKKVTFSGLKPLITGAALALSIGLLYLGWKFLYFGNILPNPYYIKLTSKSFFSKFGLISVARFAKTNILLLITMFANILFCFRNRREITFFGKISVFLATGFILAYGLFFARVDTLMDEHGRFMFPLQPILVYANIPILAFFLTKLENFTGKRAALFPLIIIAFITAYGFTGIRNTYRFFSGTMPERNKSHFQTAQSLANYPKIRDIRIAFGDAGVIAYYTDSLWLDVVGLNDGFIARTKDKNKLVNHFFSFKPDLVIHPGEKNFSWIHYGHGPLGNYASWISDPRWDDYVYIGTSMNVYDLQFLVNKSSPYFESLSNFLKSNVIDGYYKRFPYSLGTYTPNKKNLPEWISSVKPHQ